MPSPDDIASQQALLQSYRKTLDHYLQQKALFGSAYVPPHVTNGIDSAREDIARIKSILKDWGITVEDLPNDETPSAYLAELASNIVHAEDSKSMYRLQGSEPTRSPRRKIDKHPSAKHFFERIPNLSSYINRARQIDLCGVSRFGTLHKHLEEILKTIMNDGKVRILLMDDEDELAVKMSGLRSVVNNGDHFAQQIALSKERIEWLYENFKRLQGDEQHNINDYIEIHLLPYPPTFGISAFDTAQREGIIFVEIFPHKSSSQSPSFKLTLQKDGEWYLYFVDQFEKMWLDARPWSPWSSL